MVLVGRAGVGIGYLLEVVLLRQVKERGHVFLEVGLVALDGQDVVGLLRDNLLGDSRLTAHRINGDDAAADIQQTQQLRNGRNLIGLVGHGPLAQHQMVFSRPGADQMDCLFPLPSVVGTAGALAAHSKNLPFGHRKHRFDPGREAGLELLDRKSVV